MTKDLRAAKNFTNRLGGDKSSAEAFNFRCDEVDAADAEASLTERVKASSLRVNGYVMLSGNPCKVVAMSVSKPGKHGHAKIHMFGVDVFTSKKYEGIIPTTQNIEVPVTSKKDYLVVDMGQTGYLSLMDDAGYLRSDLRLQNDDLRAKLAEKLAKQDDDDIVVTVLKVRDEEVVMSVKTGFK